VWYPDHIVVAPTNSSGTVQEQRQVCVTDRDVVVARIFLTNTSPETVTHIVDVAGDCRNSADWREKPGGDKWSGTNGHIVLVRDGNVRFLPNGLTMAVGGSLPPASINTEVPGAYHVAWRIGVPGRGSRELTVACAFNAEPRK